MKKLITLGLVGLAVVSVSAFWVVPAMYTESADTYVRLEEIPEGERTEASVTESADSPSASENPGRRSKETSREQVTSSTDSNHDSAKDKDRQASVTEESESSRDEFPNDEKKEEQTKKKVMETKKLVNPKKFRTKKVSTKKMRIRPEMYSRGMHYMPLEEYPAVTAYTMPTPEAKLETKK
ncbi:MAG: hypothetical protein MUF42_05030 [Cytophagaceae bacterium]|jgi:hypothetical protein|nr:hypothetical protein [Cytophagaceae bacterium]